MPLREVRLPILPPNFSLGSTVGIVQKQKSRVLPRDNCTGHCIETTAEIPLLGDSQKSSAVEAGA